VHRFIETIQPEVGSHFDSQLNIGSVLSSWS
jgi:hypothetical protein